MAYKSPIEQLEGDFKKWQPSEFKDVTTAYLDVPETKVYRFSDGDYKGRARVYNTPSEHNIYEGRVSPTLKLWYKGTPVYYKNPEHKEFLDKIVSFLDAYGLDL